MEKDTTRVLSGTSNTFHRAVACTSLQIKMQENVSIIETIVADMPDLFYSEILPKLGLFETLNLAKVSKKYRDLVWTVAGARSFPAKVEAHFAKVNVLAGTSPA